ncbi:hypothetical protein [Pseudomonas sp. URMO17WK12:I11]|uniref:hypothetical protein n=1 Tax=Pseudomonas sp. URMO17WK12:I11 TaxID=1283291 RepID=UPI0007206701|nr:hypothetical protein [Pseudomonas sp. URMO17WK12:I11]CRL48355.1 hypothetical protein PSHI_14090 [Pseudomonas sp. URMO17WK12:I11]
MTTNKYEYGTKVAEFFKHDDAELQKIIDAAESQYYGRSEGLYYKGRAACIDFTRHAPLEQSLIEMQALIQEGYTINKAEYRSLFFTCSLRKTDAMIAEELPKLAEQAKAEYDAMRYASNIAEMKRQMEITIEKRARDAALAVAKAAVEHREAEEAYALADLLKAYSPKTTTKVKQEVAA